MALFGGERDASLFRKINKELITDIIDTEVYYYKLIIEDTKSNLYGEGKSKIYHNPIKIPTLVDRTNAEQVSEIGDVIEWNDEQHIVDVTFQNQFFAGKNPETWDGGDSQGYNLSILCETHVARKTQLNLKDDVRVGVNNNNNDLPIGI